MKIMLTLKVTTTIVAMIFTTFQPIMAQATNMPSLPWGAQLGVIGMLGALLWWQMAKVGPEESKRRSADVDRMLQVHRECTEGISCDIKEMTTEIKEMRTSSQLLTAEMAKSK